MQLDRTCTLGEAVADLLSGRVALRPRIVGERTSTVVLARRSCWSCGVRMTLWRAVGEQTVGVCGRWVDAAAERPVDNAQAKPEQARDIRAAVAHRINALRWPAMAHLSSRVSKEAGRTYVAFSCWRCSRVQGDHYLAEVWHEAAYNPRSAECASAAVRAQSQPHTGAARRPEQHRAEARQVLGDADPRAPVSTARTCRGGLTRTMSGRTPMPRRGTSRRLEGGMQMP